MDKSLNSNDLQVDNVVSYLRNAVRELEVIKFQWYSVFKLYLLLRNFSEWKLFRNRNTPWNCEKSSWARVIEISMEPLLTKLCDLYMHRKRPSLIEIYFITRKEQLFLFRENSHRIICLNRTILQPLASKF